MAKIASKKIAESTRLSPTCLSDATQQPTKCVSLQRRHVNHVLCSVSVVWFHPDVAIFTRENTRVDLLLFRLDARGNTTKTVTIPS